MYTNIQRMVRDNRINMRFMKYNSNLLVALILVYDFFNNVQRGIAKNNVNLNPEAGSPDFEK